MEATTNSFTAERIHSNTLVPSEQNVAQEFYLTVSFYDDQAHQKLHSLITSDKIRRLFFTINVLEDSGVEGLRTSLNTLHAWTHVSINKVEEVKSKSLLKALEENKNLKKLGHEISLNHEYVSLNYRQ